ncbi:capsid assembly scaffolding protein Gp46 family protein [Clostridium beijerinckii]|uniref:DUF4355 domain-containing protein n=3 Tax=Clostridium beijerinckii TaxID=1520 RepID=A0A9Q5GR31_CLOBE|nr:DUF4355 domain-containing protein [Clostridium beijerinckii]AQS04031.1 hypothetical protein CLBIJ_14460 [Clostridium beijerinckii]MBA2884086.1 hypothetical protein [Clostridium beijerinckii]MBA2899269.1 hypothetical protein [Clostridium beijerinckii]MBA2908671.1 hypothetical protein [Clostridium beijerinckii]MBA9016423.1 hypothetical protein [Clostridium beijerinckii]
MLKTELLELLKDMADDAEVNETIQGVEGLTKTFDSNSIGLDEFKNILEINEVAKSYYQSSLDSGVGKGVSKYKENFSKNELPKLVEDGIKAKSNEGKTPDQIKLDEALAEIQKIKVEKAQSEMKAKYTKVLSDKGFGTDWLDLIKLSDNEESNDKTIEKLSELYNTAVTRGINSKITENPPIPEKGQGLSKPKDTFVKGLGL